MARNDVFHVGLMAELNAASNADDAPEIEFYLDVIGPAGGPPLDAGRPARSERVRLMRASRSSHAP